MESISENLRLKCLTDFVEESNEDNPVNKPSECHMCNDNLCNNLAASSFECIQCDSKTVTF